MGRKKLNIIEFCSDKNVYFYGAGNIANILYLRMISEKINIMGFIISDGQPKEENQIGGIDIFVLTEFAQKYNSDNDRIIIAVGKELQNEIILNLRRVNILQYYIPLNSDFEYLEKNNIREIGILDTTISDENHGNGIIMQAVYSRLLPLFKTDFITRFPYWDDFLTQSLRNMQRCKYLFLGGTNALNAEMDQCTLLGINEKNVEMIEHKIVLMGVGWWRYEGLPNSYTQKLLKRALCKDVVHSVRDSYTEKMLRKIGIDNVENTGCPTIWGFNSDFCRQLPKVKGKDALVMLNPRKEKELDRYIVETVKKNYENIYFWVQGPRDFLYIKSIYREADFIPPNLEGLENFLENHLHVDYIGTRLHGGIKCIQHKKRAIIISIDNRAQEMGKDFGLPVIMPKDLKYLEDIINTEYETKIHIDESKINRWMNQFAR